MKAKKDTRLYDAYGNYAKEAYLLFDVKKFASKFSERESVQKFYFWIMVF